MTVVFHRTNSEGVGRTILSSVFALLVLAFLCVVPVSPTRAQTPGTETTVEYDAQSGSYIKVTRVGDMVINREYMTFE